MGKTFLRGSAASVALVAALALAAAPASARLRSHGDFLKLKETRELFRKEQHFPSSVIDRGLPSMDDACPDILERARQRVEELIASYERHPLAPEREEEMLAFAAREGRKAGLEGLPGIVASSDLKEVGLTR